MAAPRPQPRRIWYPMSFALCVDTPTVNRRPPPTAPIMGAKKRKGHT